MDANPVPIKTVPKAGNPPKNAFPASILPQAIYWEIKLTHEQTMYANIGKANHKISLNGPIESLNINKRIVTNKKSIATGVATESELLLIFVLSGLFITNYFKKLKG